jgi:hypothetical protein
MPGLDADHREPGRELTALDPDDEQFARVLVLMWSAISGRRLRTGTRPDQLSSDELIAFWADDLTLVSGRHARVAGYTGARS